MNRSVLPFILAIFAASTLRAEEPRAAWVASFNGPQDHGDHADRIDVTSDGYSYVLGTAYDPRPGQGEAFVLILYRPDGTEAWRRLYAPQGGGAEGVGSIQVDSQDRAVAVGWGSAGGSKVLFIARVDRTGQPNFLVTTPTTAYFGRPTSEEAWLR